MDRANGGGPGAAAAASRAERFEDEKRRIVESCFNKKDVDGSRKSCYTIVKPRFHPQELQAQQTVDVARTRRLEKSTPGSMN
jgi:hypothetical protein